MYSVLTFGQKIDSFGDTRQEGMAVEHQKFVQMHVKLTFVKISNKLKSKLL